MPRLKLTWDGIYVAINGKELGHVDFDTDNETYYLSCRFIRRGVRTDLVTQLRAKEVAEARKEAEKILLIELAK
jgi:hypothetical protein